MEFNETRLMCPWCDWDGAATFVCRATREDCEESNCAILFWRRADTGEEK
jgi:hypothetical protein